MVERGAHARVEVWSLLLLLCSAGLAVLGLEVIGIPLVVLTLVVVVWVGRGSRKLAPALMAMGAGYAATVAFFAIASSGTFTSEAELPLRLWYLAHFAFGCVLLACGWRLRSRRRV